MAFLIPQIDRDPTARQSRRRGRPRARGRFEALEPRLVLSVTPTMIDLSLAPGESATASIFVTVPSSPVGEQVVDVLFLVDVSGSFIEDFQTLAADAESIAAGIEEELPGARFGLATFGEFGAQTQGEPSSFPYLLEQPLTSDIEAFQDSIEFVRDNSEFTAFLEPHYAALWGAIGAEWEDPNDDDEAVEGQNEFSAMDPLWRDEAIKLIVLWTDEAFGDPEVNGDVPGPGASQVIPALQQFGAKVIGVSGGGGGLVDLRRVAEATGTLNQEGEPLVLTVDRAGTQLKDEIVAAAGVISTRTSVTLVPFGDDLGLTASITPVGSASVPRESGGAVEFRVTLTLTEGAGDTSDSFELRARGDGVEDLGTVTLNQNQVQRLPPADIEAPDPRRTGAPPDTPPPGPDFTDEVNRLILGGEPPSPGTVGSTFGASGGGSKDLMGVSEPQLLDQAFAEDYAAMMRVLGEEIEEDDYAQVLLVVAQTDVPDAMGYELGDESAGRRAKPTVAAVAFEELPAPEAPASDSPVDVVRGQGGPPGWRTYAMWIAGGGGGAFVLWEVARRWLSAARHANARSRYVHSEGPI